jgi:hydroxymethylpyrimidine pyrophosphatase-like HAD family hydrolase/CheY-like chemotaxis protein
VEKEYILIIEDTMGVARALQRALSLSQGDEYRVGVCDSGEAALELLVDGKIALLISDLRLPGMDGWEVLERARELSPETKSVLITAFGSPQIEERARQLTDAYLPKPFHLHEMIQLVERVLRKPAASRRPPEGETPVAFLASEPVKAGSRRATHLRVLACDLDGTLAEDGEVAPETWDRLRDAKIAGLSIILVTGRRLDSFAAAGPYAELCEAIVAEDGAVVYFPRRDLVTLPFGYLAPAILQGLKALDVPLEWGRASVATRVPHDEAVLKVLREVRAGAGVAYNRGAAMVLPLGATKGAGLRYALLELGWSPRNVVACGDAENDRSLFQMVEVAAAVSNALPDIKAMAGVVLPEANGAGVRGLITELIGGNVPNYRPRPDRHLLLGHRANGDPVHLDPFHLVNANVGIFGASKAGKSWFAGLLAEELLRQEYQICIIDPEGDHRPLGTSPRTVLLGDAGTRLPSVTDVISFLENGCLSLVLDLSTYAVEEGAEYLQELLPALQGLRARRGRPHWFLIDEVQQFCPLHGSQLTDLILEAMPGVGLVSYRPSHVAPDLLKALDHWLLMRMNLQEEIAALNPYVARDVGESLSRDQLSALPLGQAFLGISDRTQPASSSRGLIKFRVESRKVPQVRHMHKYLKAALPASKRFYFHDESDRYVGRAAASLWEFRQTLVDVPIGSLEHHLRRGDFEHWLRGVLHEDELAHEVGKLGRRQLGDEALRRALLDVVIARYEELDNLA